MSRYVQIHDSKTSISHVAIEEHGRVQKGISGVSDSEGEDHCGGRTKARG